LITFKGATARTLARSLAMLALVAATTAAHSADYFAPEGGVGPAVVLLSGASGTQAYRWYAMEVAKLGYTAVLVDGSDVCAASSSGCWKRDPDAAENLRKTIDKARADKRVAPGKVAVIGFSLGGGGALAHAARAPELVSGVVAYYPSISKIPELRQVAAQVATPTLILAGERDRHFKCCLIESMREFEAASRAAGSATELGFNLDGSRYRADDAADAWERVKAFLARVHPRPSRAGV
jgi:dienelactone hydrolase